MLGTVRLRMEQDRCATRVLRLEARWVDLRRECWALQTRAARLRSPQRIHDRVEQLSVRLLPPSERVNVESAIRLASDSLPD